MTVDSVIETCERGQLPACLTGVRDWFVASTDLIIATPVALGVFATFAYVATHSATLNSAANALAALGGSRSSRWWLLAPGAALVVLLLIVMNWGATLALISSALRGKPG